MKSSSDHEQLLHISSSESDYSLVFTSASLFMFQDDEESKRESKASEADTEESQALLDQYERATRNMDDEILSGCKLVKFSLQFQPA